LNSSSSCVTMPAMRAAGGGLEPAI
jgi:hypothetical protein